MSPRQGPRAAQTAPEPASDPLADLREPDEQGVGSVLPPEEAEAATTGPILESADEQDQLRHRMVVAMHEDLTVQGFVHNGGACGCWYITGVIARAVLPVRTDEDQAETVEE